MKNKKSLLITGASSGIGKHIAVLFAKRGWLVWAGYLREKDAEELKKINELIKPIKLDVIKKKEIESAKKIISQSKIPLTAVINNAGVGLGGSVEEIPLKDFKSLFDVNFFGTIAVIQNFLPLLRKTHGRILIMGSVAGFISVPFIQPYSTSKFALRALSDGLRLELLNQNITVSLIEPGLFNTLILDTTINKYNLNQIKTEYYLTEIKNMKKLIIKPRYFANLNNFDKSIIHALESKKPKFRYLIYKNHFLNTIIFKLVPKSIIKFIFRRTIRKTR